MTFLSNLIIHEEGQYLTGSLEGFVGGFHWIIIFFLLLVSLSLDVFPLTGDMLETPQHFMSFILQLLSLSSLWNTILGSSHTRAWGGRIRAIPTQWCQREPRVERPGWSREFRAGWIPHICTLSSLFETLPVFLIWTYTNGAEFMAENKHSCPPLGVTVSQWEIFRNVQEYSGIFRNAAPCSARSVSAVTIRWSTALLGTVLVLGDFCVRTSSSRPFGGKPVTSPSMEAVTQASCGKMLPI